MANYRTLVMERIDALELDAIRQHLQRQHAYGSDHFRSMIEAQLGRSADSAKIDRPRNSEGPDSRENSL